MCVIRTMERCHITAGFSDDITYVHEHTFPSKKYMYIVKHTLQKKT